MADAKLNEIMLKNFSRIQRDHMKRILRIVLKSKRVTRARISHLTRLSNSSIIQYTRSLLELGLLRDAQSKGGNVGRRADFLEFNPLLGVNIVIILTMTRIRALLVDTQGTTQFERVTPIEPYSQKDALVAALLNLIESAKEAAERSLHRVVYGIGISLGGYIDPLRGISHQYLFSSDWAEVPLTSIVESHFEVPCYIVNDANAATIGELYHNFGVGVSNFICVFIEEGIGMGIVIHGELYEGHSNYAGEIGHTKAVQHGELCYCGRHGCLETIASQSYILRKCREGCEKEVHTELLRLCDAVPGNLKIEHVKAAANNGDRFTQNVLAGVAESIGVRVSDAANLFNPEWIFLRGELIDGNPFLFENIRRVVLNNTLQPIADHLKLKFSEVDDNIQAKGVASYILNHYFA